MADAQAQAQDFRDVFNRLKTEIHKVFVGQDVLVEHVLGALFADGHVLLESVPGLGKTLLVHTLAQALDLKFSRIQFTPDLMPADIVGTMILHEIEGGGHELRFQEGPLVANFILADEINRATPKTQSALLEAMQERQISVARRTITLPVPFVVLATQNPIEQEGTYPLPEAQLDRFIVKLLVDYPTEEDYSEIMHRTTEDAMPTVVPVATGEDVVRLRHTVRQVAVSKQVMKYAIRLVMATQPDSVYAIESVSRAVSLGASPRGVQGLLLMAKVRALLDDRFAVSCDDIRSVALPVLRHRMLLSFEGHSDGVSTDDLVRSVVDAVQELSA